MAIGAGARSIRSAGINTVVISRGVEGSVAVGDAGEFQATPPSVQAVSAVGAGDSMVAGLVHILSRGGGLEEALQVGTAAGTASALAPGTQLCGRDEVDRLCPQVLVRQIREHHGRRGTAPARTRAASAAESLTPA